MSIEIESQFQPGIVRGGGRGAGFAWLAMAAVGGMTMAPALLSARSREGGDRPVVVERRTLAMGTELILSIPAPSRERGLSWSETAIAALGTCEDLLSTWRTGTPLARLNRAAAGRPQRLPAPLWAILASVREASAVTGGAFDPAVGPLVDAWDLRGAGRIPTAPALARARRASGLRRWHFDGAARQVTRLDSCARLEEGAFGKGAGLAAAAGALRRAGCTSALLDLGGQVLALGADASGRRWEVNLTHPRDRQRPIGVLGLVDASLSVSGNSERAVVVAPKQRIGHLLDPASGRPAADFGSVAVVDSDALRADAFSTALFVLGPERGLVWADRHGVAAIYLIVQGLGEPEIRSSRAALGLLRPLRSKKGMA